MTAKNARVQAFLQRGEITLAAIVDEPDTETQ